LYGGYAETWWGPGEDGTLLFSTSARPFPKVGFKRLSPEPIDLPVLRWLGPIRFDAFAGVLDEEREFSNPGVIGIRIG
ncbi:capsule assembly Wzi family protein, partial [Massilia sp. CT11-108]|uniref:capsule assembly Wzi family protein n=1 Tax=Massilia sp. CT11-108 TaxID=3393900 RepID=UPI0039A43CD6